MALYPYFGSPKMSKRTHFDNPWQEGVPANATNTGAVRNPFLTAYQYYKPVVFQAILYYIYHPRKLSCEKD
ncbi:MAG: hypothetical protein DWP97_13930 [Calditrichaeota bacterium]|nr:MAG: hypothetical protein DWP97_13930 [Calditrichota bacterium]